jgi:peptide/nickel transport system ATP-binding protein
MSLSVRDLRIDISGSRVVDGVSFDVPRGSRVGVIGESGSGKSLTALAIMGLLPHGARATGSVTWNGREILGIPDRELAEIRGAEIGMVFQEPLTALNPIRRVGGQMSEAARIHGDVRGSAAHALAVRLAESVGLPDPERIVRRYPHQLSGGQRQRVGIAAALAAQPNLIVADEPTTALDVTVQAEILDLLRSLRDERGLAMVFVTHNFGVVADLCDSVVVMQNGHVVEHGAVEKVLRDPEHDYTKSLLASTLDGTAPRRENDAKFAEEAAR